MIIDPRGKIAVFPGSGKVEIRVGKGGKVVHMLSSPSGHLLLPLDDKFSSTGKSSKEKTLAFHTNNVTYTVEGAEESEPEVSVEVPAPIISNEEVWAKFWGLNRQQLSP